MSAPLDVEALEESFDLVAPRGEEVVELFYAKLFKADPEARELFESRGTDMAGQKRALLGALVILRRSLRDLPNLQGFLLALGERHATYGVTEDDYPIVGAMLIETLWEISGNAWQDRYAEAWAAAYEVISGIMLQGAANAEARATG